MGDKMRYILLVIFDAALEMAFNPSENLWVSLFISFMLCSAFQFLTVRTETVTIKSKKIKKVGWLKVKQDILVTADGREFFNVNDVLLFRFGAKKTQAEIKIGKTYVMKIYKFLFANKYNILSVSDVVPVVRKKSKNKSK